MEVSMSIAKMALKGKGIFDMGELYNHMKYWLDYQGYGDENSSFREEQYGERIKGDSKTLEIRWVAEKKANDYVTYKMTITFFVLGLKPVEIEQDGRKLETNKADVDIRFEANLILDKNKNPGGNEPKYKWKNKFFQKMYNDYVIRDRIDAHKSDLYSKIYSLHGEVKSFLNLSSA